MKKSAFALLLAVASAFSAGAQSVQEGVNHLYADRDVSAKATFEKILAANPNNIDAIYWLGQTHLDLGQTAEARNVYTRALSTNGQAPLLLAGMGQVLLNEGKGAEARQQFEMALNLSRGKKGEDPAVLAAVGRANIETRSGDVAYGLSKLQQAAQLQPNNADIQLSLGDAYRRAHEGGEAVRAYTVAASSGQAAPAYYRMARIYETQRNWDVVTENLNRSIAADPKYAPAYLRQYVYNLFFKQDFATADQWGQKYVSAADASIDNEIFKAQPLYLQKRYDDAIAIGNRILSQKGNQAAAPQVYRLLAYSTLEGPKDTAGARRFVDALFANTKPEELIEKDYTLKATIYSKEAPEEVVSIFLDAAAKSSGDTSVAARGRILQEGVDWARASGRKVAEGDLRLALYRLNPNSNPAGLFQIGLPFYQGGNYRRADSLFQAYSRAFPDSVYGYLWSARSLASIDTAGTEGLAIPQYERLLQVASADPVRYRSYGIEASGNLANYYVNEKKDKAKGVEYLQKGLAFDPENAAFKRAIDNLNKPSAPSRPAPPAKPGTKVKVEDNKTKVKSKK